jgi:acyl-CoA synthetase (AMP-forming)/AMP-acid ligase II/acyl carrier protein
MIVANMRHSLCLFPELPRLIDRIHHRVVHGQNDIALRFINDDGDVTSWTYLDLWRRSLAVAKDLQSREVSLGDRVALLFSPGLDFVATFFGCQLAGAIPVPTCFPKPGRAIPRLDSVVNDCHPRLLLTTQLVIEGLAHDQLSPASQKLERVAVDTLAIPDNDDWPSIDISPESVALLQYTSGSTSEPKGVRVLHRNLDANLSAIAKGFKIASREENKIDASLPSETPQTVGVFWLPFFHDMGLIGGVLSPLYVGGTSVLMSPQTFLRRPIEWLRAISSYRATVSGAPNFAYQLAFDRVSPQKTNELDLSCWQTAFCGAEPIDNRTLGDFARRFSSCGFRADAFYPCYGLAESTLIVAGPDGPGTLDSITVERQFLDKNVVRTVPNGVAPSPSEHRVLVSCGSAVEQTEIIIVEPKDQQVLDENRVGEVWIRGASVADGYWNQPADENFGASTQDGRIGWLRSGDLGFFNQGRLFITGRLKDTLIIRGRNLSAQDIENTVRLTALSSVSNVAAFSANGLRSEALGLAIEVDRHLDSGQYPALIRNIRRAVIEIHDVDPIHIVLVRIGSLPVTTSGKIRRTECRELFKTDQLKVVYRFDAPRMVSQTPLPMPELRNGSVTPGGATVSEKIADWISRWMIARGGVDPSEVELEKPLMDYGLDSMMAIELSGEIEHWAGVSLNPMAAWDYPTIAQLAAYVAAEVTGSEPPPAAIPTTHTTG